MLDIVVVGGVLGFDSRSTTIANAFMMMSLDNIHVCTLMIMISFDTIRL